MKSRVSAIVAAAIISFSVASCATTTNQQAYQNGVVSGKNQVQDKLSSMDIHKVYVPSQIVGGTYIPGHYTYQYQKTVVGVNGNGGLQPQATQQPTVVASNSANGSISIPQQPTVMASNGTAKATANIAQNPNNTAVAPTVVASNTTNNAINTPQQPPVTTASSAVNSNIAKMAQQANNTIATQPNEKVVSVVSQPVPPPPPPDLDNMVMSLNTMLDNGDLGNTKTLYETLKKADVNKQIIQVSEYYLVLGKYKMIVEHDYKNAYDDFAQCYIDSKGADVNKKNQILALMVTSALAENNTKEAVNGYKYIGDNYLVVNDKLEALKFFYKAHILNPDDESVNIKIANLLSGMGKEDLSKAFLMKAYLKSEAK